ncbi:MAG: pseudouridine-5'-phosphate glycosidase [Deltaproteobacteria bacterium]|nr:pseudouridine-5'-phosphate glycosidase [Deltaproteobacteria bacterium]
MGFQACRISDELHEALERGQPVVALESTLITHGLPEAERLVQARKLESAVRSQGALPATIALMGGQIRIGLSDDELETLARSRDAIKTSRRDLAWVLACGQCGATTVSATMFCASLAGIRILATGGIGGVHRAGERSLDISADLAELARTDVAVVCSGPKVFMDMARSLEVLETLGVPIIGFGTASLPAFFCPDSGLRLDRRMDEPDEIARLLALKWELGLRGGVLIANPPPAGSALAWEELEPHIDTALQAAEVQGLRGGDITPFLLQALVRSTGGRSLKANLALLESNARLAARIAAAMAGQNLGK